MSKFNLILIIVEDNWSALYSNGKLLEEGGYIDIQTVLPKLLNGVIETFVVYDMTCEDFAYYYGGLLPLEISKLNKNHLIRS